jgi:hypothetical protein
MVLQASKLQEGILEADVGGKTDNMEIGSRHKAKQIVQMLLQ